MAEALIDSTSGQIHEEVTVTVSSVAGASFLVATSLLPAGVEVAGVGYRVVTSFSGENGLVWVTLGDLDVINRWGEVLGIAASSVNHAGMWVGGRVNMASGGDVILLPNPAGALFGVAGLVSLTCFYTRFIPL